ncbi:glycosyltransferase family 4 protein [Cognataquiflexum rubidum]|uniref:glycosyltransferase family 4 protein n=1 Tax=Cognataquiflexum rubidum TaxID=2922273 RepID=UPI001F142A90|nr:glycosyltransferase family 4 protein [Cognataquiflexum rubidum]MCH6236772.1 glycosyltransferase family 4 protein [Cognataquiflexum rubidum]
MDSKKITILFFIGSLASGGKERRLLELITFLGNNEKYRLILVTKKTEIYFDNFEKLKMEWVQMESERIGLRTFWDFFKIAKRVKPDIIHSWGNIQTFITLPYKIKFRQAKLVNSQITSAPPKISFQEKIVSNINFRFSDVILSNSFAGLEAYSPPKLKSKVIYNGVNLNRFQDLISIEDIKESYGMGKKFTIVMVASFSANKDYLRFFKIGIALSKIRNDVKFLGIGFFKGGGEGLFQECKDLTSEYPNLIPMAGTTHVESLINAADIGVLFTNKNVHGEGISNALIEYMALGKPVIANDAGGTKEIIQNEINGYLLNDESEEEIANLIDNLLNDPRKMEIMGKNSKERIFKDFTLERMGTAFEKIYQECL